MRLAFLGLLAAGVAGTAMAQAPVSSQAPLKDPGQKTVRIVRTAVKPTIDGVVNKDEWAGAARVDDLYQVNPVEYAPASERSEIYLYYDDDALYVGAILYQPPESITANMLRQNGSITQDDTLFITLDPFNTRRAGYFFGLNANGVRYDGLYRNVSEYYSDWDSIWVAAATKFDGGWMAEYEIPFKSLSFDPNTDAWGLNFSRNIKRRNEDMAWVSRNRRWDPSTAGLMTGLENLDQGIGLDLVPSASVTNKRVFATGDSSTDVQPSLDLFYKLTPQLNASLTFNTDFSATEVDDRQVNLTRFGLFFPEKRDFFLREADLFEFGRIGAADNNGSLSSAEKQNARPFFSRRIGLDEAGQAVDLNYGGKVSGRVGRFEIGALSIRQDEHGATAADTLSVVRVKAGLTGESTIGAVFTNGDPLSNLDNSVAGVDYLYRNSHLPGGRTIEAGGWFQESDTTGKDGHNRAAGIGISVPSNAKFRGGLSVREVEENFNPALGFISRTDIRDYTGHIGYTHRPKEGYWQSLYFVLDGERIENLSGGLQSQVIGLTPIQITNSKGDYIWVRSNFQREVLDQPFPISPGVVIPGGDYSFSDNGIEFGGSAFRPVSGRIARTWGSFYGGTRVRTFGQFVWTPSPKFRTTIGYNIQEIDLPQGHFTTRIVSTGLDWVFSPRLSWTNLIQYDNVSQIIGVNMRLNWIPQAGRAVYFVINHNVEDFDRNGRYHSLTSDVVAKINYTFRF
ncbi:MAG TPA: DUF5916 domain-containing protein [Gammaproteobacteria bacterium]|nr:DUF5916 domain-containing protein [Gammaproteobacteria bacterium]